MEPDKTLTPTAASTPQVVIPIANAGASSTSLGASQEAAAGVAATSHDTPMTGTDMEPSETNQTLLPQTSTTDASPSRNLPPLHLMQTSTPLRTTANGVVAPAQDPSPLSAPAQTSTAPAQAIARTTTPVAAPARIPITATTSAPTVAETTTGVSSRAGSLHPDKEGTPGLQTGSSAIWTSSQQHQQQREKQVPMPKEALSHGAPTRQYLNSKVTGPLLDGMKILAKEQ